MAAITMKAGIELAPGDVLIGVRGGESYIEDIEPSDLMMGMLAVETEHGFLYLDPEDEYAIKADS
jgi:hypothetical protein